MAGAAWLVFVGLIIGVAMRETGLGARIAGTLLPLFGWLVMVALQYVWWRFLGTFG